ncbi:MAG: DUF2442 domain-containing protein [Prevotellaceae bacterium]|jgi:hypothetical protein|nr:DUF2442 domain-containing protein [Prevotellaceae bacterium]
MPEVSRFYGIAMTNSIIYVTAAEYVGDYSIAFTFNDGVHKVVNLEKKLRGNIFGALKDVNLFKQFKVNDWTIEWANGVDIAPESLYEMSAAE